MIFNIDDLKKKIIYRSSYRGSKEMDYLLSSFVNKYLNTLESNDLINLSKLLDIDDDILYKYNQGLDIGVKLENNSVTKLFKQFKYVKK